MRATSLFWKSVLENWRDWKLLIMTLTFGPFFVVLIYFYSLEAERAPHRVVVVDRDRGALGGGLVLELTGRIPAVGGSARGCRRQREQCGDRSIHPGGPPGSPEERHVAAPTRTADVTITIARNPDSAAMVRRKVDPAALSSSSSRVGTRTQWL